MLGHSSSVTENPVRQNQDSMPRYERDGTIQFVHFANIPGKSELSSIEFKLRTIAERKDIFSIVVTLPRKFEALKSAPIRHQFGRMVVERGGQLCFVDYGMPNDLQRQRDEERFRSDFRAAMNWGYGKEYRAWGGREDESVESF